MKKNYADLTCENDYFSARQDGNIIAVSFKGNILLRSTLIKAKEAVLDYFECASAHPEIDIVLLLEQQGGGRRDEYLSFFDMVSSARLSKNHVLRMYRAIDQFILHILSSDMFFINAGCGEILPVFANIALACDYRVIADNAIFRNPAIELGLVPKGGSAFFMNGMLGRGKAFKLMLAAKDITAQEGEELGLVDQLVPAEDFQEEAFKVAKQFAVIPTTSLRLAKRLSNYFVKGLPDYLEFENSELIKALIQKRILV